MTRTQFLASAQKYWLVAVLIAGITAGAIGALGLPARMTTLEATVESHLDDERRRHDSLALSINALQLGLCAKETNALARSYLRCPPEVRP